MITDPEADTMAEANRHNTEGISQVDADSMNPDFRSSLALRHGTFLLLQDEPTSSPLAPKGHGTLTSLIRDRSTTPLHNPGHAREARDEEEGFGGAGATDWPAFRLDHGDDESNRSINERRMSAIMNTPQMRSMRLIGNTNPRYRWDRYWKTPEQLKAMEKKQIRQYYERTNYLIQQYLYIDRLLDSSLPHDLLNEYSMMPNSSFHGLEIPNTISEESSSSATKSGSTKSPPTGSSRVMSPNAESDPAVKRVKRTPKDIYRATETTHLLNRDEETPEPDSLTGAGDGSIARHEIPFLEDDEVDSSENIVTVAIYVNMAANAILLAGKIVVIISVPSVSVLASLVDALLDFLSTAIVWTTTWLIAQQDQYRYPIGRRRLEPLGVLVFSIIMITSFVQVALQAIQTLAGSNHEIIELGIPAIAIMLTTIAIKGVVWLWYRMVKNSSVQALASDAATDVIFNAGSIAFPIIGFYAKIWWLDALGGLLLSLVVIFNWSSTSSQHIKNLCGFSATADQRNILLYLTMRFAKTIKQIQGLQAYHAGDKLFVEVDIVLDQETSLKDSHDIAESLQYVLESVPIVDRAFVHVDYASWNLPTHMEQQAS